MLPNFFYHPRMRSYDFGPGHPLKPLRLRRTTDLLSALGQFDPIDPGTGSVADVLKAHDPAYVDSVRRLSDMDVETLSDPDSIRWAFPLGFGSSDNPPFPGMFEAALAYVSGSAEAARRVRDGERLAFGIAGGLHHARRSEASGFCIFNDCAVACHILRERYERVAYVDIDVHHGDGVQWIFYEDPTVLTCSIHEDPKTLYPGTGFVHETGADYTAVNVPVQANTTGDVWLWAFENGILPAIEKFKPEAIVLQTGADSHFLDPLAHIRNTAQDWLSAVWLVRELDLPMVYLGGGGYDMTTVPRMWTAGCLTYSGIDVPESIPEPFATEWGVGAFLDADPPGPSGSGKGFAEQTIAYLREHHFRHLS